MLAPAAVPLSRTRSEAFDDLVLDAVEELEEHWSAELTGVEFAVTGTEEVRRLEAGLVLTSIGYRGKRIRELPFDESAAVVPNDGGRVVDGAGELVVGEYCAGWIKRGPSGVIGTNKKDANESTELLWEDVEALLQR